MGKAGKALDYAKAVVDKIFKSGDTKSAKEQGIKELTDYFASVNDDLTVPEKPQLDDVPTYERLEYDAPSDEKLAEQAEQSLGKYKDESVTAIENELNELKKQYESGKDTAAQSYEKTSTAVKQAYEDANRSTDNDLLKRGIARSSIAANKKAELASDEAAAKTQVYNAYQSEIDRLTTEIDALDAKRVKALDSFNIAYAAKLTETINELKTERDNNAKEAIKYNNSLSEKEYSAKIDKAKTESELYGEALSNTQKVSEVNKLSEVKNAKNKEMYSKVYQILSSMNAIDARELIMDSPLIRENLSGYYYSKLYEEFAK